jgi:hypothetical protein
MSFLDKAKEKAAQLTQATKEKIGDIKDSRKADDLLDDLGRVTYRAHTGRAADGDDALVADLVAQLQALEADGTPVLGTKEERAAATDAPAAPPPPPPAS